MIVVNPYGLGVQLTKMFTGVNGNITATPHISAVGPSCNEFGFFFVINDHVHMIIYHT